MRFSAPRSPESTIALAALMALMPTSGSAATSSAASYGVMQTAIMPPPGGRYCMKAPRMDTSFAASVSVSAPAIVAAANSPTPWPRTAAGRTPASSSVRARAYSTANRAGWVSAVRWMRGSSDRISSTMDSLVHGRIASSASSRKVRYPVEFR